MYKLSLKYFIAGIVIFTLFTYLSNFITANLRYSIFFLILVIGLAIYLIKDHSNLGYNKENQLYNQLLQKSRNDQKLVERLIEYERHRRPNSSRIDLLESAIYHWERDRR